MLDSLFENTKDIKYVDVVLPLSIRQFYTYSISKAEAEKIVPGIRVVVQLGRSKLYSSIVVAVHNNKPKHYETKPIEYILDEQPIILPKQLDFWRWIAEYYMCTVGEVYRASLPSGLRLESELKIRLNQDFEIEGHKSSGELRLVEILKAHDELSISEATKLLNRKNIFPMVQRMQEQGILALKEEVKHTYKPKQEYFVRLNSDIKSDAEFQLAFKKIGKAQKQEDLLLKFLSLSQPFSANPRPLSQAFLLKESGMSKAVLKGLEKKGILEVYQDVVGRLKSRDSVLEDKKALSEAQNQALDEINSQFKKHDIVLLKGVTSSGKTEVYIHLIEQYLQQGKTVLYILPEIALTTQIVDRLSKIFGDAVAVYHSKFNDAERVEMWHEILKGEASKYKLILGVRSSIFLPFSNLGLIIVDEEHETAYKQFSPNPRYQTRDASLVLAQIHKSKVLLGTATPSVETWFNTQIGKYGLVTLNQRYNNVLLPDIELIDMQLAHKRKQVKSHFSNRLLEEIQLALENKKQIILFQNRRGYAPFIECNDCGWVPECEHCDVSLTYHKYSNDLQCHYCGFTMKQPKHCLACSSPSLSTKGFGTEKIEDEIKLFFPDAKVARLDLDTTRKKYASETIIYKFERGEIDILVGTQMVSKGLDFSRVSLVAVLNADSSLNYPDFRAEEKSYQLFTQVSGRAGRKDEQGKVLIQTKQPQHPILSQVISADFEAMYQNQISERQSFFYPPYVRLVELTLKHKKSEVVLKAAHLLAKDLRTVLPQIPVLGPQTPVINRIQGVYLQTMLIKLPKNTELSNYKKTLRHRVDALISQKDFRSVKVLVNIDPY